MSVQGSPEWHKERAGHVTASCFSDVRAKGKGNAPSKTRENYKIQLVTERLTGEAVETYSNKAMEWGNQWEPYAREDFEAETGLFTVQVGFLKHLTIPWVGASPDSLIEVEEGLEIKCPFVSTNHVMVLNNGMPSEHIAQVQGNLWVTGRKTWYFVSFDPRMPRGLRLYVQKVERDDAYIAGLEADVLAFLTETNEAHERILRMKR